MIGDRESHHPDRARAPASCPAARRRRSCARSAPRWCRRNRRVPPTPRPRCRIVGRRVADEQGLMAQVVRQQVRIEAHAALAADLLRGAGLAGHRVGRAARHRSAGAAGHHRAHHAFLHRAHIAVACGDPYRFWLRQQRPRQLVAVAPRRDQMRPAQVAAIGDRRRAAHQLQRGGDPRTLADAGIDGFARIPRLLAVLGLVLRRRHRTAALADQVDAGRRAETVAAHVTVEALDAHLVGELVVVEFTDAAIDLRKSVQPAPPCASRHSRGRAARGCGIRRSKTP